jgi:parvulin-like peptidyl-prolyl isomerase
MEKIIVAAMRGKNVKSTVIVSPTKVDEYYRKHREEFTSKEEVKLRMIMIPSRASQGNAAAQKALAEEILGKLAGGADFERMAQMYSEDSTRDVGGDWGWIERKTLAGPLEKVAFSLRPGKISGLVELGGNYYILRVDERRGGVTRPMAEVRADIEKKLQQEEAQRLQDNWLATLRQKAHIRTF